MNPTTDTPRMRREGIIMGTMRRLAGASAATLLLLTALPGTAGAHDPEGDAAEALKGRSYDGNVGHISPGGVPLEPMSDIRCEDGMAGIFACHKVDLAAFVPLPGLEASFVNDVWGWQDPVTGMQVAIAGTFEGTAFVDVTDGSNPVYLGTLPSAVPGSFRNIWGDIRVYENTAYIVTEAVSIDESALPDIVFTGHGVQVVDLNQFRGATEPIAIAELPRINDVTQSHNLSLNEDSGRLYVVGSVVGLEQCQVPPPPGAPPFINGNGGALIYDVATDPANPQFLGCLNQDGYTHDIQCVVYSGPDPDHQGSEICLGSNEDTLTLYDATDPTDPQVLSVLEYREGPWFNEEIGAPNWYTHQGWLTEDQQYFFLGDELDELFGGEDTRNTYIWDVRDLDNAQLIGINMADTPSIDHNMFVYRGLLYQSNYTAGLTIYDTWKAEQGRMTQRGFFDVYPASDEGFAGTWGNYPFFGDGKVIVTSGEEGLFVLQSRAKSSDNTFRHGAR